MADTPKFGDPCVVKRATHDGFIWIAGKIVGVDKFQVVIDVNGWRFSLRKDSPRGDGSNGMARSLSGVRKRRAPMRSRSRGNS